MTWSTDNKSKYYAPPIYAIDWNMNYYSFVVIGTSDG